MFGFDGKIVIISVSKQSQISSVYQHFLRAEQATTIPYSEDLAELLKADGFRYRFYSIESAIEPQSSDELREILALILNAVDTMNEPTRDRMAEKENRFATKCGYRIHNLEHMIVVEDEMRTLE